MSEKHYPYIGGAFDRIVFDGDGSVWVKQRTCRIVPKPSDSDFVNDWHYLCSECGCEIPVYERNPDDYRVIIEHANYCPNCGAKVVER